MSIFRRSTDKVDDSRAFDQREAPPAPPPIDTAAIVDDPEKLRRYVMTSLLLESRHPDASPSSRIAALKALSDMALVSAETQYRIANKDVRVSISIEQIGAAMLAATERVKQQTREIPAIEVSSS